MVDTTKSFTIPAFTDSVDSGGSYTLGICGEKLVELIDPPQYLSITLGANKVDPFKIVYNDANVKESDVTGSVSV